MSFHSFSFLGLNYEFHHYINDFFKVIFGFFIFYAIYFLSFIFLKNFFQNYTLNLYDLRKVTFILILIYYLSGLFKFLFFQTLGVREWGGVLTPLWIICPLIIFDNLTIKKILILSLFILIELTFYTIFFKVWTDFYFFIFTILVLVTFPLFTYFLKNNNLNINIKNNRFKNLLLLPFLFLGAIFMFLYYWLF